MKIHGMCMVKDEADVIEEALRSAAEWCDHIYVYDNGSTDGTWEVVQRLASEIAAIVPWKSEDVPFTDGLRAGIFDRFRAGSRQGDWWVRLDADELYIDDPRVFLAKVPERYRVVWTASFSYYFTDADADAFALDPARYADEVPVEQKIRYYVNHWSEPRFFRHRDNIEWTGEGGFPDFVATSAGYPVRIWLKHFPYRSPQQIAKRLAARTDAVARGEFGHEAVADWGEAVGAVRTGTAPSQLAAPEFATLDWEERVVPAASLDFDRHDRRLVVNEALMPAIPRGASPLALLAARARRRVGPRVKRVIRRVRT
jgi:hypothetical protein